MNIRTMTGDDLPAVARVNVDTFRATHQGIVPDSYLQTLTYENAESRFANMLAKSERKSFIFVAEAANGVVGYAMAGLAREPLAAFEAELYGLYVLPEYHRRGIGRDLVHAAARKLHQRHDAHSLYVWVFEHNVSARKFYESLGGNVVAERPIQLGGDAVSAVAYGWPNIVGLLS